ncbi:unnamed protein product [Closterium sp. Yama58-4]|nr:unnamed protein product [Closterium sp. Yama58-4]
MRLSWTWSLQLWAEETREHDGSSMMASQWGAICSLIAIIFACQGMASPSDGVRRIAEPHHATVCRLCCWLS